MALTFFVSQASLPSASLSAPLSSQPTLPASEEPSIPLAVEMRDVTRKYGELRALDRLSLKIHEGEIFGILGPNGAGKSTAIQILCGLLRPDAGEIRLYGRLLSSKADATSIGICPQRLILWGKMTCFEQLVFLGQMYDRPRPWLEERADFLLGALQLREKAHALAKTLSGGMQRRLNLLMALIHDPALLVLDEPEAGLDPQSRVLVREFLRGWIKQPGKTAILTSHDMDEVERLADRVGILDRGRLLVVGTPDALKATIGQGDILKMTFPSASPSRLDQALFVLGQIFPALTWDGETLVLRHPDLVAHLTAILELLRSQALFPSDLQLRPNTLEDVFLALTGRSLRET